MSNDEFRASQAERRAAGLKARHETRQARAQTVIGEWDQQAVVQAEREWVRLVVADETGESFSAIRLAPEAAERLAKILLQTKAIIEAREIDSKGGET